MAPGGEDHPVPRCDTHSLHRERQALELVLQSLKLRMTQIHSREFVGGPPEPVNGLFSLGEGRDNVGGIALDADFDGHS
jgi:hypothetical protein